MNHLEATGKECLFFAVLTHAGYFQFLPSAAGKNTTSTRPLPFHADTFMNQYRVFAFPPARHFHGCQPLVYIAVLITTLSQGPGKSPRGTQIAPPGTHDAVRREP